MLTPGRNAALILTVWIGLAALPLCFVAGAVAGLLGGGFVGVAGTVFVTVSAFLCGWPRRYVRSWRARRTGRMLTVESGVFRRVHRLIPLTDRCTLTCLTTPLQRHFGCTTALLCFAGGRVILPVVDEHTLAAWWEDAT